MEIDITQWWVPAVTMMVLGAYVFLSAVREARLPMPVAAEAEVTVSEAVVTASKPARRGFLARTSWIWGSVLVGAVAQAYLSYVAG